MWLTMPNRSGEPSPRWVTSTIIERNAREQNLPPLEPDRVERYRKRSAAERVNARLKDNHGGRTVRVRGAAKVHLHRRRAGDLCLSGPQLENVAFVRPSI